MKELTEYLVGQCPVDIDLTDNSDNTAWNHACILLKPEIAFAIKKLEQLTYEDREFVHKYLVISSKERYAHIKKNEIDEMDSQNRLNILFTYQISTEYIDVDGLEYFKKDEVHLMDLQHQPNPQQVAINGYVQ